MSNYKRKNTRGTLRRKDFSGWRANRIVALENTMQQIEHPRSFKYKSINKCEHEYLFIDRGHLWRWSWKNYQCKKCGKLKTKHENNNNSV